MAATVETTQGRKASVGRPPVSARAGRHEAILDAATAVFLEHGFGGASTAEIAQRAGASKHTIYSLFPSKAALFAALMTRRSGRMIDQFVEEAVQPDAAPRDVLHRYGCNILTNMLCPETSQLHRLLICEAPDFPELAVAFWENGPGRGRDVLKRYLTCLTDRGVLAIANVDEAAEQLFGALLGGACLRSCLQMPPLLPNEEQAISRWVSSGVDAFLRAYRP